MVITGSYNKGIVIEQNYTDTAVSGTGATPTNNIPITGLKFSNIKGTVRNTSVPIYVVCAEDGCIDWEWENVDIYGQVDSACVNFHPDGITCVDYSV